MPLIALGGCIPALFAPDWGFVLFCHGLGLGVGGALLGTFQHVLGKRLPDVCALTCALGLELMLAFPCFAAAVIGFVVTGIGYFPIYSMVLVYNSRIQRPKKTSPSALSCC